jgi:hypothetical protein
VAKFLEKAGPPSRLSHEDLIMKSPIFFLGFLCGM